MHRFLLVASLFAAACTSEPSTDTGKLVRVQDQFFDACRENVAAGATCAVQVTFTDVQVNARGVFDDGSATGPEAIGTLSDSAKLRIADLIAHLPLESPETVHDVGCGGPPARTTGADINFDHDGARHFAIEYASDGPMADFSRYLNDLVTGIRLCNSSELAFDSCEPNIF